MVTNTSFDFYNVELLATGQEDEYAATYITQDVFELDTSKCYVLTVNGSPCQYTENSYDYVKAEYKYNFYNTGLEVTQSDSLYFTIAFYKTSTVVIVSTKGGASAVAKWHYYFKNNNFTLTITQVDNVYFGESIANIQDLKTVQLYIFDELYKTIYMMAGTTCVLPIIEEEYFTISTWQRENDSQLTSVMVKEDITLNANITYKASLTDISGRVILANGNYIATVNDNNLLTTTFYITTSSDYIIQRLGSFGFSKGTTSVSSYGWKPFATLPNDQIVYSCYTNDGILIYDPATRSITKIADTGAAIKTYVELSDGTYMLGTCDKYLFGGVVDDSGAVYVHYNPSLISTDFLIVDALDYSSSLCLMYTFSNCNQLIATTPESGKYRIVFFYNITTQETSLLMDTYAYTIQSQTGDSVTLIESNGEITVTINCDGTCKVS